jgi:predicted amidohydrolase YtcJ
MLHISGDSLGKFVVTAMQRLAPDSVWRKKRRRIEHFDGIAPDLQPLVARLGIVVVVNPTHFAIVDIFKEAPRPGVRGNVFPGEIPAGSRHCRRDWIGWGPSPVYRCDDGNAAPVQSR